MKLIILLLQLTLLLPSLSCGQQYRYRKIPDQLTRVVTKSQAMTAGSELLLNGIQVTSFLPIGYVKDGSIDYTNFIQKALNKNTIVIFPDFPVLINSLGLDIKDNSTIIFQKGSQIRLKPTSALGYQIMRIHNRKNVKIYSPKIIGDRNEHLGTKGEWGMGISVRGSKNVTITNPHISKCWGDGLYIGGTEENTSSENIEIINAFLDNNRRNGISIINCINLKLTNPVIANTEGILPMSGIVLEPNNNNGELNNILIDNPITFNNKGHGLFFALHRFAGDNTKEVNVIVNNHVDSQSSVGFGFTLATGAYSKNKIRPFRGSIKILNPIWRDNQLSAFNKIGGERNGMNVNIVSPQIFQNNYLNQNEITRFKNELKKKLDIEM